MHVLTVEAIPVKLPSPPSRRRPMARRLLASLTTTLVTAAALGAPLDDMVALDAVYIPALATTSAAAQDSAAVPRAHAAIARLQAQWPGLRQRLLATWGPKTPDGWTAALAATGRHIDAAANAASQGDWPRAHEALEPVRIVLMQVRDRQGMDYFVDRLTAFHEPMERLAQAGSTWTPAALDPPRRDELERAFAQARALWHGIEGRPAGAAQYGLSPARSAQLRQAIDDESAALARLSEALRGADPARILAAAAGTKPPFARAFTAFGQPGTEAAR